MRIDAEVDDALREWASREGVSISSFANRALRKHVEWDVYADRFGFVSFPEDALARITARLSQAEARELGHWFAENVGPALLNFWFSRVTAQEVLHTLPRILSRYARLFEFEERDDSGHIVQVFKHGGGRATSALLEGMWRRMYEQVLPDEVKAEVTDDAVILSYRKADMRGSPRRARQVEMEGDIPA